MLKAVSAKTAIDKAYGNLSICKSLVVCHDDNLKMRLFDALKADDYPISLLANLNCFENNNSRMLLIDFIDIHNLHSFLLKKTISEINVIFIVEGDLRSKNLSDTLLSKYDFKEDLTIVHV